MTSLLAAFDFTQSALSQHLAVLRGAGLVEARKQGRQRFYRLATRPLREVADWVCAFEPFWDERLERLGRYLEKRHGRR